MVMCPECNKHEGVNVDFNTAEQSETEDEICTLAECFCGCKFHLHWEINKTSVKGAKPDDSGMEIIVEQGRFIESRGVFEVMEYDINKPNSPPTKKQLIVHDPIDGGCRAFDWTPNGEGALAIAGVDFDIYDPNKPSEKKDINDIDGIDKDDNL